MILYTLTQKSFVVRSGDRSVLWIDPAQVAFYSGTKWPVTKGFLSTRGKHLPRLLRRPVTAYLRWREPFAIPRHAFGPKIPVEETSRFRKIEDFIRHMDAPRNSLWYAQLMAELERNGVARHKTIAMQNEREILEFLDGYSRPLIESMRTEGYKRGQAGFESTAVIDAEGRLCKSGSGNHRFNIARALSLPSFPLRIVAAHEDWMRAALPAPRAGLDTLIEALQEVGRRHR